MATVRNEYHLWPASSPFVDNSNSSNSSSNLWHQQQQQQQQQQITMDQAPSPYSLSDYFMLQQPDEDIFSMSSLESTHSGLTTDDDDEQITAGTFFTTSGFPTATLNSLSPSTASSLSQNNNILLEYVVKSKLENIETALLGEEEDMDEGSNSSNNNNSNNLRDLVGDGSQLEQIMPPPPPVNQASFSAPTPESLGTIRSFNFQRTVQPQPTWQPYGAAAPEWEVNRAVPPVYRSGEDPQVLLVHLLVMCAHAVAQEDYRTADVILVRLRQHTSPSGTPMERLATYFSEALAARADYRTDHRRGSGTSSLLKGLVSDKLLESDGSTQSNMLEAFSTFYDYLPIGKFDHLTMNQVILDSVERERAIHILDLQLWFGTQWPALLQSLATRPGGPPRVRITAVGTSAHDLQATGLKLKDCARTLRVHLEFHQVQLKNLVEEFDARLVELRPGEAFIVNSLSQFHYLLTPSDDSSDKVPEPRFVRFMQQVRSLRPKVLVMAENDASHNSSDFLKRFGECLKYYSAVFDAMATCASSPAGRLKMERLFAAPKIRNIIACEGVDRVERHESMPDWIKRLESAGFRSLPLSQRAINQAKLLLRLYYTNGYTLYSERGYLVLGWRNLPLNTVSAWRLG